MQPLRVDQDRPLIPRSSVRVVARESPVRSKGQIIETVNGQRLADVDPRIQLGRIITQAEATDGAVNLMIKEQPDATPRYGDRTRVISLPKGENVVLTVGNFE